MKRNASWKQYAGIVATLLLGAGVGGEIPQVAAIVAGEKVVNVRAENPFAERFLAQETPEEARQLYRQAQQLYEQGKYAEAIPLAERALAIVQESAGSESIEVATLLNFLGLLHSYRGNYDDAELLYQRSLTIYEKALGDEHPDVAVILNNLAGTHRDRGNYAAAEPLFQRSLAIKEKALGSENPSIAISLNNLAGLYELMGNYKAAERLYQRSLVILEKAFGSEHLNVAMNLNNLAVLYYAMGEYDVALPLYQRTLTIKEKILGTEHPSVATSLNNLAVLYSAMGKNDTAVSLYQRSLSILEKAFGSEHPNVAASLNGLALLYRSAGNFTEALSVLQRALAIQENTLAANHPAIALSLNNLAGVYHTQNDLSHAIEFLQRGINIEENNLSLIYTTGSETEKRAYINTLSGTTNATVSLNLQAPNNPETTHLALTTILRRKGRILDALSESLDLLRQNLTPENQALIDKLADTRRQLAALIYTKPENLPLEQYRQRVAALKTESEKLEAELSRRSAEFRVASAPVTIEAVQQLIPKDTALVEIVRYHPFNPKAKQSEQWGEPRYAAYILKSTGEPQALDLGEAAVIDAAILQFRQGLVSYQLRSKAKTTGRELDVLVMQPIRAKLGGTKNLLVSPDGQLNLIPFAALTDENDRYLVENYRITYLTTGRDLIRLSLDTPAQQPPVVVANPNYDIVESAAIAALNRGAGNARNRRSGDLEGLTFNPLPGTKAEAEAIAPLLEKPALFLGARATENAVKQVRSPRILHLATHGFFFNVDLVAPPDENASAARPQENPLLRSGLAFAGINARSSGDEDGVLTALEAAQLNLRGTQLVVLSACETGLGETANGEGVYGLRRAITIAGARSQAMSLWAVSDTGTKELMVKYYRRALRGEDLGEAMRQVQLEMLQDKQYEHPYYWAAFIPLGDWRAISR